MQTDEFKLYDISDFPVVRIQGSLLPMGYAPQWIAEMDALLARAQPFVFIFLDSLENPAHEDQKAQTKWLKANKAQLRQVCRGFVSVEPERAKRILKRAQALAISTVFGLRFSIVPDKAEAAAKARLLLAGIATGDDPE